MTPEPHNSRLIAGRCIAALALFALAAVVGVPRAMAQQAAPPAQAAGAKDAAPAAEFDVFEFFVEGNSVLSAASIENAVYRFMGEKRSLTDVQNAREALEAAYRDRGYLGVSVLIPQQQVRDGVVRLEVVEAKVTRTRVKDAQYTSPAWVREQLPSVAEGTVPNFNRFESELVGLNRMNLLTATPLLRPGADASALDVDVLVEDRKPWALIVDLNNNAAVNTKPLRLGVAGSYNNLFGLRHSLGAQFVVSPQDTSQVKLGTVNYSAPLGGPDDATLTAYYLRADSGTPTSIGGLTVVGKQSIAGLRYVNPVPARLRLQQAVSFGVDYKQLDQGELTPDGGTSRVTYLPFYAGYNAVRPTPGGLSTIDLSTGFSISGVGSDDAEFAARRYGASASYLTLRGDLSHETRFDGWSLRGRLAGQYANQPLIPSEQYILGGMNSVRGYYDAEQIGDRGYLVSIEARGNRLDPLSFLRQKPAAAADATPSPGSSFSLIPIAFVDAGLVRILDPLPSQISQYSLASVGLGFRSNVLAKTSLSVDVARALRSGSFTQEGDYRANFRLIAEF